MFHITEVANGLDKGDVTLGRLASGVSMPVDVSQPSPQLFFDCNRGSEQLFTGRTVHFRASVRHGQPTKERRQIAIGVWPHHQVPVIGHHTIGKQPHLYPLTRLRQHPLERLVIPVSWAKSYIRALAR